MVKSHTQVSVIVPAYNAAAHLKNCLDSLLAQTIDGLEIIVIDDGSVDATPAILRDYAARSTQIRVYRQINSGVSVARNNGMARARGEFVAFMDADDTAEPTMYADMLALAHMDALDIVVCNAWVHGFDGSLKLLFPATEGQRVNTGARWITQAVASHNMRHYIWCHLYRRAFLAAHQLQFAPNITHQDIVWTNAAMLAARRVGKVNRPLYHYIKRNGSLSKPESGQARLMAARHYMRVASLLEGLAHALVPAPGKALLDKHGSAVNAAVSTAVLLAVESQLIDEGLVVFHIARHLPFALRQILFAELNTNAHLETLTRHATTFNQRRRIWKSAIRYKLFCTSVKVKLALRTIFYADKLIVPSKN